MSQTRYEIREPVGKGGLGAVFKAFDTQLQRDVALKRILDTKHASEEEVQSAGKKLLEEAQTLSLLNHPNIVTVFDVGQDEEGGFVVMELLNGETLDDTVARGVLTQEDFTEVVYQTMEALIAAQALNVIHRDLKPPNVMVIWQPSGKFQTKILDFGLAKFSKSPSVQTMDQDDAVMGSIFFMAPEQFERAELDARTDLYQIGCVYYHSLTGQYPFRGETAPQVMNAHLQHRVTPLEKLRPDLAPSICQWVMWLINRDMANRPGSAREALEFFPKNPETPAALPAAAVVEPTQATGSSTVKIVKAPSHDATPPSGAVLTTSGQTGSTPVLNVAGTRSHSRPISTVTGSAPVATAGNEHVTGIPVQPPKSRKFLFTVIGICIASILAAVGYVVHKKNTEAAEAERFLALSKLEEPVKAIEDGQLALKFLQSDLATQGEKQDARKILVAFEGDGVNPLLLEAMNTHPRFGMSREIGKILAERGYSKAVPSLLSLFRRIPSGGQTDSSRIVVLNSIRQLADESIVPEMLNELAKTKVQADVRHVMEDIVLAVLRQKGNGKNVTGPLLDRVARSENDDEKRSLFRILGLLGGKEVQTRLSSVFRRKGSELGYQLSAMVALTNWQNRDVLPLIEEIAKTSENEALQLTAAKAYMRVVSQPAPIEPADRVASWQKAIDLAGDKLQRYRGELQRLFTAMMDYPDAETEAKVNELAGKPLVGGLAKSVQTVIKKSKAELIEVGKLGELTAEKAGVRGDGKASRGGFSDAVTNWISPETWIVWKIKTTEGGTYQVEIEQATPMEGATDFQIIAGGQSVNGTSKQTESWDEYERIVLDGELNLEAGKVYTVFLKARTKVQPRLMNIKTVRLLKK